MSKRIFLDSNILVYAVTDHPRAALAQAAVQDGHVISVQVLNEFANVARRKLGRSPAEIRQASTRFRAVLEVLPVTLELHDAALSLCERYAFSFFDALIVATALEAGCTTLHTEDLQHQLLVNKQLRVLNPFV